ncbi:MAG: type II toxin-antitoxin system prevent-host-death family antitoxin [Planctomycetes bacterium]|nr:type II toxin-antitoxin system prevent-host-death family antitoxin [Planctomycetota bacterium]
MKDIELGVREFQAHLGNALRAVRAGRRVVITSRARPVAILVRPEAPSPKRTSLERKLERMVASGFMHRGTGSIPKKIHAIQLKGVVAQLLADRR